MNIHYTKYQNFLSDLCQSTCYFLHNIEFNVLDWHLLARKKPLDASLDSIR